LVFLDSNIFIIDRFFRQDTLYPANRAFVERLAETDGSVPLLTLMELCGAASFRLAADESERWLYDFAAVYRVRVVNPFGAGQEPAAVWLAAFVDDLSRYLARRMTFGNAVLAREADRYGADAIVTWNVKDFDGRTAVPVVTPDSFFR
jgi:hypothetical protein